MKPEKPASSPPFLPPARRRPADWETLRQRLERARAALEQDSSISPQRQEAILAERARKLAAPRTEAVSAGPSLFLIEFSLAGESYAVEARFAQEVAPLRDYSLAPGAPSAVLGIVNLRGRIVSVIDLKRFFDLPDSGITDMNKVIVIRDARGMEAGLLADAVLGARHFPADAFKAPPASFSGIRTDFTLGVTKESLALLDAERILASETLLPLRDAAKAS